MRTTLPLVGICTYGKPLGKEIAACLSNHPFEVMEFADLVSAGQKNSTRPLDMIGLILPPSTRDEVAQTREQFPRIPILVISKTGREVADLCHPGNAEPRLYELKARTALQEICWWVANELASPIELKELSSAQIRPALVELDGQGNVKPDPTLRSRWIFPGREPHAGKLFAECLTLEDQETFMRELQSLNPQSQFSVFPVRIRKDDNSVVVEAGLRRVDENSYLLVLQPLAHEMKTTWEQVAKHDPLTRLYNRWGMTQILENLVLPSDKEMVPHYLVYLDVDRFKSINEILGSQNADEVLVQVARLIEGCFPEPCISSRFMGDEFLVITRKLSVQEVKAKTEKLMQAVRKITVNGITELRPSISAGICELLPERKDMALRRAEQALRRAKDTGRGIVVVRKDQSLGRSDSLLMMDALNRGKFTPWLQPVLCRDGKKAEFYEALARFKENGHYVSPMRFLRLRGTQGLISWLDRSIFIQVLNLLSERSDLKLSVNLSAESLALSPFPSYFFLLAREASVDLKRILVEVSEEVMKLPKELVLDRIHKMTDSGIQVILDDFGSGLSPLAYLIDFPFSIVKLDGNLTHGIEGDGTKFKFVKSIVEIAHASGMQTVAEHVETQVQNERLMEAGVDFFQGNLFGVTAPPETYLSGNTLGAVTV